MLNLWDLVKRLHNKHSRQQANGENDGPYYDSRVEPRSSAGNGYDNWRQESSESWPPNEADYGCVKLQRDTESEWEMWTLW